eukprot:13319679-Heterocapsa_arctica.AAC.1
MGSVPRNGPATDLVPCPRKEHQERNAQRPETAQLRTHHRSDEDEKGTTNVARLPGLILG